MPSSQKISSIFAKSKYMIQSDAINYIEQNYENPINASESLSEGINIDDTTITTDTIKNAEKTLTIPQNNDQTEEKENNLETEQNTPKDSPKSETETDNTTNENTDNTEQSTPESETNKEDNTPHSVNPHPTDNPSDTLSQLTERVYDDFDETQTVTLEDIGISNPKTDAKQRSGEASINITKDVTGNSTGTGEFDDFADLFTDRYDKLRDILLERFSPVPINAVSQSRGRDITIIGRVTSVGTTGSGNRRVSIEDKTGEVLTVFSEEREQKLTEEIVEGEVVCIEGQVNDGGEILFGDKLHFPSVPPRNSPTKAERHVKAAFISDIHLGADTFSSKGWNNFVDWIQDQSDIEYLFIAGDVVEGIGVYPGQEEILTILDMYRQYELCGEAFKQLPDDLEIILCTGNHDMVRLAEPQPALPEKYAQYFPDNVTFTGNPATINIENGITVEFYHGMSINGFTDSIPDANVDDPTTAMKHMVKKRHLAPLYGYNTRISPEEQDYLVLNDIPDILHSGHVHTFGVDTYQGVTLLNTGAWQYQTDFQKKMNIVPDVASVAVTNLQTFETEILDFLPDDT